MEVDIPALNELLKSHDFWGSLAADGVQRVLFFQTDSLLLHGNVEPFMQVGGSGVWPSAWLVWRGRSIPVVALLLHGNVEPFMLVGGGMQGAAKPQVGAQRAVSLWHGTPGRRGQLSLCVVEG